MIMPSSSGKDSEEQMQIHELMQCPSNLMPFPCKAELRQYSVRVFVNVCLDNYMAPLCTCTCINRFICNALIVCRCSISVNSPLSFGTLVSSSLSPTL